MRGIISLGTRICPIAAFWQRLQCDTLSGVARVDEPPAVWLHVTGYLNARHMAVVQIRQRNE